MSMPQATLVEIAGLTKKYKYCFLDMLKFSKHNFLKISFVKEN
jgi:hypothetical protein